MIVPVVCKQGVTGSSPVASTPVQRPFGAHPEGLLPALYYTEGLQPARLLGRLLGPAVAWPALAAWRVRISQRLGLSRLGFRRQTRRPKARSWS
jgi:hypothetical protein